MSPWPTTHRMTGTKEYRAWAEIKRRCFNTKSKDYQRYGAKGISMDTEYATSFENWLYDIGLAPSPHHSVDRVDNTKGYIKGNMRWATIQEQTTNRKTTWLVTINGKKYFGFSEAAKDLGISKVTVRRWCQGYTDKRWRGYTYLPKEGCYCEPRY